MRHYAGLMVDRDVIRRAYACSIMLGIRAGGHGVNVGIDELTEEYEATSWISFAVAKAMRAVMADLDIPAPGSLAEIEACAGVADVMCGSDPMLIDRDVTVLRSVTVDAVQAALACVADDDNLTGLLAQFPIDRLVVDAWAA